MLQDKKVISVQDLTKQFGNFTAVDAITFDVYKGEIFGFLGANGAGKTTAMKMLIGLSKPTMGSGQVAGYDIIKNPEKIKKNIGYMSQKFALYDDLTIIENATFYGGIYGLKKKELKFRIQEMLVSLNLQDSGKKLVGELPQGWKQRLAFSVAMLHNPPIIFLDEPTGGVDPATRRIFWEKIYAESDQGRTIFVTTHYMDEAEYCHRISMMVDGKIIALDTPSNLKTTYNVKSMNDVFIKLARGQRAWE
jgi:ABC-2 type transport system ATP-binding protein